MSSEGGQRTGPAFPLRVLGRAARLYGRNGAKLLLVALVGQAFFVVGPVVWLSGGNLMWWMGRSLLAPGLVLRLWAGAAMVLAVRAAYEGRALSVRRCFERVSPVFWWYAMATVLYMLLAWVGFYLLVVMWIYWGTLYSLAGCAAVLGRPSREAGPLRLSARLVKGNFWPVFGVVFLLWLMSLSMPLLVGFLGGLGPCGTGS